MPSEPDADFELDRRGLTRAFEMLARYLSEPGGARPAGGPVELGLPPRLPEHGTGGREALEHLGPVALDGAARLGHPGVLAHMDPPTPWFTWATGMWTAALNQNVLHPETAPAARRLEELAIRWLSPFFGMRGGQLVPGSSVATLTALWVARDLAGATEVVASEAAHVSVEKAAVLLGLPLRVLPVDGAQRLEVGALGDLSRSALVLTAGTTSSGAVDPLSAGADAAWRHVDAAWAGPLRMSKKHFALLDGIDTADSVGLSGHKWLFQPKDSAAVLFADPRPAEEVLSFGGGYLSTPSIGVMGSRGDSALPLVATLLSWGRVGVAARVEHGMAQAAELADLVASYEDFELYGPPQTGVVLFRPRTVDARTVQRRMTDAYLSVTKLDGVNWLRSVAANPAGDPELIVERVLAAVHG